MLVLPLYMLTFVLGRGRIGNLLSGFVRHILSLSTNGKYFSVVICISLWKKMYVAMEVRFFEEFYKFKLFYDWKFVCFLDTPIRTVCFDTLCWQSQDVRKFLYVSTDSIAGAYTWWAVESAGRWEISLLHPVSWEELVGFWVSAHSISCWVFLLDVPSENQLRREANDLHLVFYRQFSDGFGAEAT